MNWYYIQYKCTYRCTCAVLHKTQKVSALNESQCGSKSKKNYRNQRLSVLISVKAWSEPSENLRILHVRPLSGRTKAKWKNWNLHSPLIIYFRYYIRALFRVAISMFLFKVTHFLGPNYPEHPVIPLITRRD